MTADLLCHEPFFDVINRLKAIPMLHAETPLDLRTKVIDQASVKKVTTFTEFQSLEKIVRVLNETNHNGFPVVAAGHHMLVRCILGHAPAGKAPSQCLEPVCRQYQGFLTRSQILQYVVSWGVRNGCVQAPSREGQCAQQLYIPLKLLETELDLRHLYKLDPRVTVVPRLPLYKVYRLFFLLGWRHACVVDKNGILQGIVTRKDLVRFESSNVPEVEQRRRRSLVIVSNTADDEDQGESITIPIRRITRVASTHAGSTHLIGLRNGTGTESCTHARARGEPASESTELQLPWALPLVPETRATGERNEPACTGDP